MMQERERELYNNYLPLMYHDIFIRLHQCSFKLLLIFYSNTAKKIFVSIYFFIH